MLDNPLTGWVVIINTLTCNFSCNYFTLLFQSVSTHSDVCAFVFGIGEPMARSKKGTRVLDIFPCELRNDGSMVVDGHLMAYDDWFPMKKCMLGRVEMTCPKNPIKFLETHYGSNMLTPAKNVWMQLGLVSQLIISILKCHM